MRGLCGNQAITNINTQKNTDICTFNETYALMLMCARDIRIPKKKVVNMYYKCTWKHFYSDITGLPHNMLFICIRV